MERKAGDRLRKSRQGPANAGFLIPDPGDEKRQWGANKPINKRTIVDACLPKPINQYSSTRDRRTLYIFLQVSKKNNLCFPKKFNLSDILPSEVPLVDLLKVATKGCEGWDFPSQQELSRYQENRGLDSTSYEALEGKVKEITIGQSTDDQIDDTIKWFTDIAVVSDTEVITEVTSFDVEDITIRQEDLLKLTKSAGSADPVTTTTPKKGEKQCQFPVKILIGNGLDHLLVISWPAEMIKYGSYKIWPHCPQKKIIDFLANLGTVTGLNIRMDVSSIEKQYSDFSPDYPLKMGSWLDLTTLAAAAGIRLEAINMVAMSYGVLGGMLDKISSRADGLWCLPWDELPLEFKNYALGDSKFGHMAYNVLIGILLNDIFPDREALGFLWNKDDLFMGSIFCKWVKWALENSEMDPRIHPDSRAELLFAIKPRQQSSTGKWRWLPTSNRVMEMAKLLGNWPTLTFGGPAWLHQVRFHLITQVDILMKSSSFTGFSCVYYQDGKLIEKAKRYLTFCQPPATFDQHSTAPYKGLHYYKYLAFAAVDIDPKTVTAGDLIKVASVQTRSYRYCVLEFARLNPQRIKPLLARLEKKGDIRKEFWLQHNSLYEELRLMHIRIYDVCRSDKVPPIEIDWIEEQIDTRQENLLSQEYALLHEAQRVADLRRARVEALIKLASNPLIPRAGMANLLPADTKRNLRRRTEPPPPRKKTTTKPFAEMMSKTGPEVPSKKKPRGQVDPKGQSTSGSASRKVIVYDVSDSTEDEAEVVIGYEEDSTTPSPSSSVKPNHKRKRSVVITGSLTKSPAGSSNASPARNVRARVSSPEPAVEVSTGDDGSTRHVRYIPAGAEGDPLYDSCSSPEHNNLDDSMEAHEEWDCI